MFGSSLRGAGKIAEVFSDELDEPPDGNAWMKWIAGAAVPAALTALAFLKFGKHGDLAKAGFCAALALFVHFHYFWGLSTRLSLYSGLAKSITAIPLAGAICYLIFQALVFG